MTRNLIAATLFTFASAILVMYIWVTEQEGMAVRNARIEGQKIAKGAFDYESNCARCHGMVGEGISGTRINFLYVKRPDGTEEGTLIEEGRWYGTDQVKEKYGTLRNYIEATAASGIRGTQMLVWSQRHGGPLRDDQIANIATYIMSWQGQIPDGAEQSAMEYQREEIQKTMEGDAPLEVGEAVYSSICSSCHTLDTTTKVGPGQGGLFGPEGTEAFGTLLPNGREITYENFRDWVHEGSLGFDESEIIEPVKPYWESGKNRTVMTPFPTINDKAMVALIAYMSQFDRSGQVALPVLGPDLQEYPRDENGDYLPLSEFLDEEGNILPEYLEGSE
jgi:mono/diheme cytochrome c family protein